MMIDPGALDLLIGSFPNSQHPKDVAHHLIHRRLGVDAANIGTVHLGEQVTHTGQLRLSKELLHRGMMLRVTPMARLETSRTGSVRALQDEWVQRYPRIPIADPVELFPLKGPSQAHVDHNRAPVEGELLSKRKKCGVAGSKRHRARHRTRCMLGECCLDRVAQQV